MIRQIVVAAIAVFSSSAFAHELKFDFGFVEVPACYTTKWNRSNSIQAPVPENRYGARVTLLIAKVIALPEEERDIRLLQSCGEAAKKELNSARSVANIRLFSELFEDYMRNCARANSKTLQIYRAFVDYEDKCAAPE